MLLLPIELIYFLRFYLFLKKVYSYRIFIECSNTFNYIQHPLQTTFFPKLFGYKMYNNLFNNIQYPLQSTFLLPMYSCIIYCIKNLLLLLKTFSLKSVSAFKKIFQNFS